ncbi:hypothetical protein F4677DRAFT_462137 [Hypoxylon crocopeplum]|nr:hypothetical protein F4677DRAFT_462137 [Hypoxylon crocopeplum]
MSAPPKINSMEYFYAVGNTPAVSLIQAIPPGVPVDVLLLGCGDVRNILFTSYASPRAMDVTCCDLQQAIIARNVLILSLIVDDKKGQKIQPIWNIHYHFYLDAQSFNLLRSQARKLYQLSATMETWKKGQYGVKLRFCDSVSLAEARKVWEFYGTERKGLELEKFKELFESTIETAKKKRADKSNSKKKFSYFRSAFPAHSGAIETLKSLEDHFWEHGTLEFDAKTQKKSKNPNPMFLTLDGDGSIYYWTNPLHGFHLAMSFVSIDPKSALHKMTEWPSQEQKVVTLAQGEFRVWTESFRETKGITLRFHVGDAVPFAYTLKHQQVTGANTANWYRDQNHLKPLVLDGKDYVSGAAPLTFDVIDTSNLCDTIGRLTLLAAVSPLLRNNLYSTLYTEALDVTVKTHKDTLDEMLCGDVPTISTLIGLFPIDYWTNTSSLSTGDETMENLIGRSVGWKDAGNRLPSFSQLYLRTCWKRPLCVNGPTGDCLGLMPVQFEPEQLGYTLYKVYYSMFGAEPIAANVSRSALLPTLSSSVIWQSFLISYNRLGFISFLRLVRTRVECDWDAAIHELFRLVMSGELGSLAKIHLHELLVYIHMLDVYSGPTLAGWKIHANPDPCCRSMYAYLQYGSAPGDGKWGNLRDWENIPAVVCVTFQVPREKLSIFADDPSIVFNAQCIVIDSSSEENIFGACQLVYGSISTSGERHSDSFQVSVAEDGLRMRGKSPLAVSFLVTSALLLKGPEKVRVALGIYVTPITVALLKLKTGKGYTVCETPLNDGANVYVTRYSPGFSGLPKISGFAPADMADTKLINKDTDTTLKGFIDEVTGSMTKMTVRLTMTSPKSKNYIMNKGPVQKHAVSPCQVKVTLGHQASPLTICFPVFLDVHSLKTRGYDKEGYVEIKAAVGTNSEWTLHPEHMYPIHLPNGKPVNWNMSYINLDMAPLISRSNLAAEINWLGPHLMTTWSSRERRLAEADYTPCTEGECLRLGFKETLYSMITSCVDPMKNNKTMMAFALYNIEDGENGPMRLLFLVAGIRLDLSNRVVVLDCAVFDGALMDKYKLSTIVTALGIYGRSRQLKASEIELWRRVVPAWVERCRAWEHRKGCEYAKACAVPVSVKDGEPFLCSCGRGKFPPRFIHGHSLWNEVSKYAVHAAISPPFWAPFAEEMYEDPYSPDPPGANTSDIDAPDTDAPDADAPDANKEEDEEERPHKCTNCGEIDGVAGVEFMVCNGCKRVKYCSEECQRQDWKTHKPVCKPSEE